MDDIRSQRNKEKFSHEGFLNIFFQQEIADGNRDTILLGSFDDIDCVTKESNGLCKAMQTTASWTNCVNSPTISR